MRRRRGDGAAPAEACGVWLDTAELKRGRARPLTLRAPRAAGRQQSLVLLPQPGSGDSSNRRHNIGPRHSSNPRHNIGPRHSSNPRPSSISGQSSNPRPSSISWQSSILSFFSPQPDDKENRRPAAPCEEPRLKILPLPQLEGARQEPPGAGGHSRGWGRDKPRVSPAGTAPGDRTALPCPGAGAGGTNPAPGAAPSRGCCSPQSPGPAQPLRERGQVQVGPCRESPGCRGSRDRDWDRDRDRDWDWDWDRDRDRNRDRNRDRDTQSPNRDRNRDRDWDWDWDRDRNRDRNRDTQSPDRNRDRDWDRDWDTQSPNRDRGHRDRDTPSPLRTTPSPSRDRVTPSPLRATPSPPQPPELGSEPLFTQDSEGNRVIKHW